MIQLCPAHSGTAQHSLIQLCCPVAGHTQICSLQWCSSLAATFATLFALVTAAAALATPLGYAHCQASYYLRYDHGITELFWLEKTFNITESNY